MGPRIRVFPAFLAAILALPPWSALADPAGEPAGRVVLVPLNLAVRAAPELEPGMEPVWQALLDHLEAREPQVAALDRESAALLWRQAAAEPEARNAEGGRDVYAAYAHFARRVAAQAPFASLVIPSLVTRAVKVAGRRAAWDGVEHTVDLPGLGVGTPESSLAVDGMQGTLHAASLHVAVLAPDGALRFEGAGGLTLLQQPALLPAEGGSAVRLADREDAFGDRDALQEGIETAFERPLPAARVD